MKRYLVFDIGCMECGESSQPLALFENEEDADKFANEYIVPKDGWGRKEWHGEHCIRVYDLKALLNTKQ